MAKGRLSRPSLRNYEAMLAKLSPNSLLKRLWKAAMVTAKAAIKPGYRSYTQQIIKHVMPKYWHDRLVDTNLYVPTPKGPLTFLQKYSNEPKSYVIPTLHVRRIRHGSLI